MDHLKTLKLWINQYIQILILKSPESKNPINKFSRIIVEFVVGIKALFKQQSGIDLALLQFIIESLYCADQKECQNKQHDFVKLLANQKQLVIKSIQIFIRVTIMGLSLKISASQNQSKHSYSKIWQKNFMKFYNCCQLQMSFLGQGEEFVQEGTQFSALLLKFLYESEKIFKSFEFYENLGRQFAKLQVQPLIKWSTNRINQLSRQMDQMQQNQIVKKQPSRTQNKINLRPRKLQKGQKKDSRVSFSEDPMKKKQNNSQNSALKKVLQSRKQQKKYTRRTIHQQRKYTIRNSLDKSNCYNSFFQEIFYQNQQIQQNITKQPILHKKQSNKDSQYVSKVYFQQPETQFCVNQTPPRKKKRDTDKQ